MSFDVNIGRSEPIIKAAANMNNDGGSGGNTGYMMGGRKKKKDEDSGSLFSRDKKNADTFEISGHLNNPFVYEEMTEKKSWIDGLIGKLKG